MVLVGKTLFFQIKSYCGKVNFYAKGAFIFENGKRV